MSFVQAALIGTLSLLAPLLASETDEPTPTAEQCAAMPKDMPADRFWSIVDKTAATSKDQAAQLRALSIALRTLTPDDIVAFELAFGTQFNRAYSWDLWGAAYVANGGASDDGFAYFRYWLI